MARYLPSLTSLRAFEAAARLGSFTLAALELGTTQPGISRHIQNLESQLGDALFVRLNRKVVLTPAGRELAKEMTTLFDRMAQSVGRAKPTSNSRLRITAAPSLSDSWLIPRLTKLHSLYPDVTIQLDRSRAELDIEAEGYDVAIRTGLGSWPGLTASRILPFRLTPLCNAGFATRAHGKDVEGLLAAYRVNADDPNWERWSRFAGYGQFSAADHGELKLSSRELYVHAIHSSDGLALLSPDIYAEQIADGSLVQMFSSVIDLAPTSYWLAYPKRHAKNLLISRLLEILR